MLLRAKWNVGAVTDEKDSGIVITLPLNVESTIFVCLGRNTWGVMNRDARTDNRRVRVCVDDTTFHFKKTHLGAWERNTPGQ